MSVEFFSEEDGVAREIPKNPPSIPHNPLLFHLLPKDQPLDFLPKDQPLFFKEQKKEIKYSICGFIPLQFVWRF